MLRKLIVGIMILVLSFATPATAAEKQTAKAGGKTTAKSAKCWKRMPPLDKVLMTPEYNTVCKAYEEVLNTTCELPEKLMCNWTLPKGEKRFKKLVWQSLDPKKYRMLTEDYVLGEAYSKKPDPAYKTMRWNTINLDFKKAFDEDKLNIKMTVVDIDHDGKEEYIVRYSLPSECNGKSSFLIMTPETKRLDWRYKNLTDGVNALSEGSEILLYEGKAFMFKIENIYYEPGSNPSQEAMIYEGYPYGAGNLCRFKYLKGGKKQ